MIKIKSVFCSLLKCIELFYQFKKNLTIGFGSGTEFREIAGSETDYFGSAYIQAASLRPKSSDSYKFKAHSRRTATDTLPTQNITFYLSTFPMNKLKINI
jgi:hypothetical protein